MLTAKNIEVILAVSKSQAYSIIHNLKRINNLKYAEKRIPREIVKSHYGLTDVEIDRAITKE